MSAAGTATNQAELLLNAFHSFNEVSSALQSAYQDLQDRVRNLSEQLEQRNYFLTTVLESLPCGVLVVDRSARVTTLNEAARRLFDIPDLETPFGLASILGNATFSDRADMLMQEGGSSTEITMAGEEERTLHCSWAPLRDGERVLVVQDLSRVRRLEKRMREAERLAAMGEMALEVAHEIRNPLGALELFASLLGEDDLSGEERARYLANVQIGIRSLNTVLNNMLCIRRSPEPRFVPTRLGESVSAAAEFMRPLLEQRGISLTVETLDETELLLDAQMIQQVLTNLLTNAVQALPEGGSISVHTTETEEHVVAEIADTGVGIPQKYQRLIFDSGFSMSKGGSGLGLAIVRRLVDQMGGSIEVESSEGQGTRFCLTFLKESRLQ
ncbi:MAG: ATP-binding protein [Acidobacteriota bacterium]